MRQRRIERVEWRPFLPGLATPPALTADNASQFQVVISDSTVQLTSTSGVLAPTA